MFNIRLNLKGWSQIVRQNRWNSVISWLLLKPCTAACEFARGKWCVGVVYIVDEKRDRTRKLGSHTEVDIPNAPWFRTHCHICGPESCVSRVTQYFYMFTIILHHVRNSYSNLFFPHNRNCHAAMLIYSRIYRRIQWKHWQWISINLNFN